MKEKASIYYLNKALINLNITNDLVELSKKCFPISEYRKYFNFELEKESESLRLVKKPKTIKKEEINNNGLPF